MWFLWKDSGSHINFLERDCHHHAHVQSNIQQAANASEELEWPAFASVKVPIAWFIAKLCGLSGEKGTVLKVKLSRKNQRHWHLLLRLK